MTTLAHQIKNNLIAIISLVIAIIALGYTTWREERTEANRNTRMAAFEVLKNLGQLQLSVNFALYQPENSMGNPFLAWGYVSIISDMSRLMPAPVPETIDKLLQVWNSEWQKFKTSEESAEKITKEIDASRQAVLDEIQKLR